MSHQYDQASAYYLDKVVTPQAADIAIRNNIYTVVNYCPNKSAESCVCGITNVIAGEAAVTIDGSGAILAWVADTDIVVSYDIEGSDDGRLWEIAANLTVGDDGVYSGVVDKLYSTYRLASTDTAGVRRAIWSGNGRGSRMLARTNVDKQAGCDLGLGGGLSPGGDDGALTSMAGWNISEKTGTRIVPSGVLLVYPAIDPQWDQAAQVVSSVFSYYGVDSVQVLSVAPAVTPEGVLTLRQTIKAAVVDAAEWCKAVHIIGDANDWADFSATSSASSEYWTGPWLERRENLIGEFGYYPDGQPEYNLVPTLVVPDPGMPDSTTASLYPYFFSDLGYVDFDGDQIPDISVSRWPVDSVAEIYTMVEKMTNYMQKLEYNGQYRVAAFIGDQDYYIGFNDGVTAARLAEGVLSKIPSPEYLTRFYESDWILGGSSDYRGYNVSSWNQGQPDIAIMLASKSNRYNPANTFCALPVQTWDTDFDLCLGAAVVLAAECGAADFVSTEQAIGGNETPVCERFLLADDRGALSWIGPTVGSGADANAEIAARIVARFYEMPERAMAESFRLGIRDVLLDGAIGAGVMSAARSYVFLGDPISDLRRRTQECVAEVSLLTVNVDPLVCAKVQIRWATDVYIKTAYSVAEYGGSVIATGQTPAGTTHIVDFQGTLGVRYAITVTAKCEGGTEYIKNWIVKTCAAEEDYSLKGGITDVLPNPFNPNVTIRYNVERAGTATVTIYDVRGRKVADLLSGFVARGEQAVVWRGLDSRGRRVGAGVYLVVVSVPGITETRKIVLLE